MSTEAFTPSASTESGHGHAEASRQSRRASALAQPAAIVLALTVAGAALRFGTLDTQSIWADEAATLKLVRPGLDYLFSHIAYNETTPPLYFVLVWAWTKVFGAGVLGFRSFSALAGTLTIPVAYLVGRHISPRVGLWTAALTVVSPAMYYYSQEARSYALLILLAAAALAFWQRCLTDPRARDLAAWSALSALALLTHYFAVFVFVPEALILARRCSLRRVLPYAGMVVLVGCALVPLAASQRAHGKGNWIEAASLASRLAEVPKQFLVGLYSPVEIFTTILGLLLAAGALALLVRRGGAHERGQALDLAIVAAVAVGLPALLAATRLVDVFDGRNVMATWIPCAAVVATGLGARRAGSGGVLCGAGLCALSLAVIVAVDAIPGYQRDDWRGIAGVLARAPAGSVIVIPELGYPPLSVYLPRASPTHSPTLSTGEVDFVNLRTRRTGRTPLPAVVPAMAPRGFRPAGVRRTEAYGVSWFRSARSTTVSASALRRLFGEAHAEVALVR